MPNVVGLFDNPAQAQDALQRLRSIGVPDADIRVAVQSDDGKTADITQGSSYSGAAVGAVVGGLLGSMLGLFIGLGTITIPSLGILAAGGPLATTLLGAGVGVATGGLVGALADAGVPPEDALAYESGVKEGKVLVTARVPDEAAPAAQEEMNRAGASTSPAATGVAQLNPNVSSDESRPQPETTVAAMAGPAPPVMPADLATSADDPQPANEVIENGGGQKAE